MEDLSKELKVLLYKRINSPFWVFYFISLIICNYKFILFLVSSDYEVLEKINIIEGLIPNSYSFLPTVYSTLIIPISISLSYIIVFPFIERKILMPIWKKHKMKLKEDYAKLDKQEIMTGEEKSKYLDEILNLKKEKDKLVEDLTNIDLANESKINKVKEEIAEKHRKEKEKLDADFDIKLKEKDEEHKIEIEKLNMNFNIKFKENENNLKKAHEREILKIQSELNNCNTSLKELQDSSDKWKVDYQKGLLLEIESYKEKLNSYEQQSIEFIESINKIQNKNEELTFQIKSYQKKEELENELKEEKYLKYLLQYSKDEMKYFETIHKYNISQRIPYNDYVTKMTEASNLGRNTIECISDKLEEQKLITRDTTYIYFEKDFKKLIYEIFGNSESDEIYTPKTKSREYIID